VSVLNRHYWYCNCKLQLSFCGVRVMRIRMLRKPRETCIDGVRLDRFEAGQEYEIGSSLASLFVAEGWAEPIPFDEPDPGGLSEAFREERRPNLMRERYSVYVNTMGIAHDIDRRRRRRRKTDPQPQRSR
jgi:hypothetical protein